MSTVNQAFQEMTSALELTDNQQAEATRQQTVLRENLRSHQDLDVVQSFLSGSYKRNTAIRPLHDIDCVLVLNPDTHAKLLGMRPHVVLQLVQRALNEAYPNKGLPKVQNRSVNIQFSGTGIGFDVVPAFENGSDFLIPDQRADAWIHSNPRRHAEFSTQANDAADKKAKPLVKVAKHWLRKNGKPVKSFHLEIMAYQILNGFRGNYIQGIEQLFSGLVTQVWQPCPEPAGLGSDLDSGMTAADKETAATSFRAASEQLKAARRLFEVNADLEGAHYTYRSLFGDIYPEPGRAPRPNAPAVAAASTRIGSVDAPSKRFG